MDMDVLKRGFSVMLAMVLVLGLLPVSVSAEEEIQIELIQEETVPLETTVPEETVPVTEETLPEITEPVQLPEQTLPEETVPETTQLPEETEPTVSEATASQEAVDSEVRVFSHSGNLNAQAPSKAQIAQKYRAITNPTSIFAVNPSVRAPYAAGRLSDSYLQNGLALLNFIRTAANLPLLQLDEEITDYAQHGAVVLAAIDDLTHTPPKPADMDNAFYEKGYAATSSSNISYNYGYSAQVSLQVGITGCIEDSDPYNITRLGHRRWFLNPELLNVGFGYAQSASRNNYSVMKVFDRSGYADYDFVAYPAAGNFPTQLFDGSVVWSVTVNPNKFQTPVRENISITITRQSDGRSWTMNSRTGNPVNHNTACLGVDTGWYGIPNCIIFNPGSSNLSSYSGIFNVEITGLQTRDGSPAKLEYQVDFFNASSYQGHTCTYTTQVTPPTCTERGYTTHTCSGCGDSYVDSYVDATGHSYGDWAVVTAPTVGNPGKERRDCENCDHFEEREIPPLEDTPVLYGDVDGDGRVNTLDRMTLTRYLASWTGYPASIVNMDAADVNQDGRVNTRDRMILTRHLASWQGYEQLPFSE